MAQNLTLLIKELEEPLSKSWQWTIVGGMDPHFYYLEKMGGLKGNLEMCQKLTRKLSWRNEDSLRETSQAAMHRAIMWKQSNKRANQT